VSAAEPVCPCEGIDHPREIFNPPGRSAIRYRVGEFAGFREALLAFQGEQSLARWRPRPKEDLAVQLVDWWAYLADILTFYNERIASQAYLRTADLPESVSRLVRVLGYRPRPGIAATGTLAALLTGRGPLTVPAGFQIASKPGPGKQPQTFEVMFDAAVQAPDVVMVEPVPHDSLTGGAPGVLLAGVIGTVKAGDRLLLNGPATAYLTVEKVSIVRDSHGRPNTRVTFVEDMPAEIIDTTGVGGFQLLRSALTTKLWTFTSSGSKIVDNTVLHLEGLSRQVKLGDPVVLVDLATPATSPKVVTVAAYSESIWFANGNPSDPSTMPSPPPPYPIPIPHSKLTLSESLPSQPWQADFASVQVLFGFRPVGRLIPTPPDQLILDKSADSAPSVMADGGSFPDLSATPFLLEDANKAGMLLSGDGSGPAITLGDLPPDRTPLPTPLRAYFGLLNVSRGTTVPSEILGSGDATRAFQDFKLAKAPVTYLFAPGSPGGLDYKSTIRLWVDGIEWKEVASFYAVDAGARVFVTREDEEGKTHVAFGDAINGARLSSGTNNVVASYRYGSGAESPAAGSLTVVTKPRPGLKGIRNPVAVSGGGDPDSAARLRELAPRSVLAFGRAVSADDFEVIAAGAPGVTRARAYFSWDATLRRGVVTVYVGDDERAVCTARAAIAAAADPNRWFSVQKASPLEVNLFLTVEIDAEHQAVAVRNAVVAALADPDSGLFSPKRMRIGEVLYDSEVYAACQAVEGVVAVHDLSFRIGGGNDSATRHDPGEGAFFTLVPDSQLTDNVTTEVSTDGG
jgi:uncharacterized phage protein gp47/JayE